MERLDFELPEFTRLCWASDAARDVWEPRFRRITQCWLELEWRSISAGVRSCGVTIVSAVDLIARAGDWARLGLSGMPLEIVGDETQRAGESLLYRVVVGAPADVGAFRQAWDAGADDDMGRLLGYPACCVEFSRHVWEEEALTDTTWPMAQRTAASETGTQCLELESPPETNILWRWMGLRAVPHLPCRFDCAASLELGRRMAAAGRQVGFADEMDWLLQILAWPVEWSCLHGIAEIKTPVLKVSTRTDATATKYTVRRRGAAYPAEGARGLTFPYQAPRAPMSESPAFQRGLANPLNPSERQPDWSGAPTGFVPAAK
jgi:hypothetical protein